MRVATMMVMALTSVASADRAFDAGTPMPAAPPKTEPICFIGRPQPYCATVISLEVGYAFGKTSAGGDEGSAIIPLQAGLLVNISKHNAVGASAGIIWLEQFDAGSQKKKFDSGFGAFVRYRRWLYDYFSVDVSVGAGDSGAIGELALQVGDVIAFTGGMHQVTIEDSKELAYTFGFKLGGVIVGTAARLMMH